MAVRKTTKRLYLIPVLSKALDILELLQAENQPMTLEAIHRQTRISKTTVYRVLKTFVHRGYLSQSPDGLYRQVTRPKKLRFGFGGQSADMPFSVEVTESLKDAAASVGVDLLILDNRYDAATALKNAEEFVRSKVDLVIEFQVEQEVAPMIGDKIAGAEIPLIAIDIPHPHATYFGVDNYRVGIEAGETLAAHATANWEGKVDWVIGLDLPEAGQLVQSRITGAFEGVRSGHAGSAGRGVCADRRAGDAGPEQEADLGFSAAASEGQAYFDCGGDGFERAGRGGCGAGAEAREACGDCGAGLHRRGDCWR